MSGGRVCPICDAPTSDGGACRTDTQALLRVFTEAPALLLELQSAVANQTVMFSQTRKVRGAERPLPVNFHAVEVRDQYAGLLVTWADACGAGEDVIEGGSRAAARWLAANIQTVRMHEAVADMHGELMRQESRSWRAVDIPRELIPIGTCGAPVAVGCGEPTPCGCRCHNGPRSGPATLACDIAGGCGSAGCDNGWRPSPGAIVACDRALTVEPGQGTARCPNCRTVHDVRARQRDALRDAAHMQAQPSQLAAVLTALGLTCSAAVIRGLAHRGKVLSTHTDDVGRTWYRLGDVHDAWILSRKELTAEEKTEKLLAS